MSISHLTRCHAVVGQSPDPRADLLSRRRGCVTVLGESDRRGKTRSVSATVGDRYTTTASAEAVCSWIKRLFHHRMTSCEVCDAQSPARRPHRRVWSLRCELELDVRPAAADNARGSAVTVTTSAEVVVSSTWRLSHHHMMSGNVCDGLELVRRAYSGRVIMEYALSSPSAG